MKHLNIPYILCDVFTEKPLSGNSLIVFFMEQHPKYYNEKLLLSITNERQYSESVFVNVPELIESNNSLKNVDDKTPTIIIPARVFTNNHEFNFASHELLGAAAAIQNKYLSKFSKSQIQFELNSKKLITVDVSQSQYGYQTTIFQGKPDFLGTISNIPEQQELLKSLNLIFTDYDNKYPIEVISTGLKYLIIPVKNHEILSKAENINLEFSQLRAKYNADFVYVVDIKTKTARTWKSNNKISEGAATGSAAGSLGAYFVKHGISSPNEIFEINQGEFIGRSSKIKVQIINNFEDIVVSGGVCLIGNGCFNLNYEEC